MHHQNTLAYLNYETTHPEGNTAYARRQPEPGAESPPSLSWSLAVTRKSAHPPLRRHRHSACLMDRCRRIGDIPIPVPVAHAARNKRRRRRSCNHRPPACNRLDCNSHADRRPYLHTFRHIHRLDCTRRIMETVGRQCRLSGNCPHTVGSTHPHSRHSRAYASRQLHLMERSAPQSRHRHARKCRAFSPALRITSSRSRRMRSHSNTCLVPPARCRRAHTIPFHTRRRNTCRYPRGPIC